MKKITLNPPLLKVQCYKCGATIEAYYYGHALNRDCPACRTQNRFDDTCKVGLEYYPSHYNRAKKCKSTC